ncbi:MAG: beta-hydroxyacyl-ACP dehydratase, partial [Planctomycetota bacterium]
MWIDTIVAYEPDRRLVAIKNVSLAEEHLHEHFPAAGGLPAQPVMPACLMVEGMAQTAGILAGSLRRFREKVVLAKIQKAEITQDVVPGQCIRYDARIERI